MPEPISIIVAGLSALAGAWLGASIALRRFKRERGFERRLDWHERTMRALQRTSYALARAGRAAADGDTNALKKWIPRYQSASAKLDLIAAERYLYTTLMNGERLEQALAEVAEDFRLAITHPSPDTGERLRGASGKLLTFSKEFTDDIRYELL